LKHKLINHGDAAAPAKNAWKTATTIFCRNSSSKYGF